MLWWKYLPNIVHTVKEPTLMYEVNLYYESLQILFFMIHLVT